MPDTLTELIEYLHQQEAHYETELKTRQGIEGITPDDPGVKWYRAQIQRVVKYINWCENRKLRGGV